MKSKAKALENRIHNLQAAIYDYQSYLEDKAATAKSNIIREKYVKAAELAGESGFELDVSWSRMLEIHKNIL